MNLFFARLTGKFKSTEKFEKHLAALQADAQRYHTVEAGELYKEYLDLKQLITSDKFKQKKAELTTRKYKNTEEYDKYTRYQRLKKDKTVKKYIAALTDEERQQYAGAMAVREYETLKAIVETPEFEQKRLFWADSKRWNKTDEARKEQRFEELKKHEDIVFFLKANKRLIDEWESWKSVYTSDFSNPSLEKNKFSAGFWFKQAALKRDFSYAQEAQAYMGDKNVEILNNQLSIVTRKEHVEAPAWDEKKGFIMHPFDYTSAVINTGGQFSQPIGMFSAKVKASGKCHSAIYLVGENRFPLIELFHYNGKHIIVGITDKNGRSEEVIKGISANDWHVFSVAVNRQEIIWLINEHEVFRTKNPLPGQNLYIAAQSFAPVKKAGEGRLDIAYIKTSER